jgi:hypothetical protein
MNRLQEAQTTAITMGKQQEQVLSLQEKFRNTSSIVCSLIVSNQSFICPDHMKLFDIGSWDYKQTER